MNARVGVYSVRGQFGGEWQTAAQLLRGANIIHPYALLSVKKKFATVLWQSINDYDRILNFLHVPPEIAERCINEHLLLIIDPSNLHQSWLDAVNNQTWEVERW